MKLDNSNFKITTSSGTYYFSTALRARKFSNLLESNRKTVTEKINRRYRVNIICRLLADIYLYQTIENRGFLIETPAGEKYYNIDDYALIIDNVRG